ncbi:MAG: hypothetical protein EON93_01430 [Burkholderiales bacterium]|nr:MAG: hypothetical protein EON93_01430 [Burkholderiales bacterium]
MDKIDEYQALLAGYEEGMYTEGEVVSASLGLLFQSTNREALWAAFVPEHREYVAQLIKNFDETAEPFAIKADPVQVWREMSALKQWFTGK